ncbi:MAG: hypothetical protein KC731_29360 [Myxococcales bacterium]|nr:hypothetical protein [Myxococcales bacterium]
MQLTDLETAVIESMLADKDVPAHELELRPEAVIVRSRKLTGVGFLTELQRSPQLKLFSDGVVMRWGRVGARLNATRIETGYLVYVDDGYLAAIEGYTYGDEWPDTVAEFELYDLVPGTELENPPR